VTGDIGSKATCDPVLLREFDFTFPENYGIEREALDESDLSPGIASKNTSHDSGYGKGAGFEQKVSPIHIYDIGRRT